jgi:tetratricopeptide (TPR) repeat protein
MFGDAFLKNNMYEKAQAMFEKVKSIDPQNPATRLHLAQLYLKQGAQSEAKKEYLNLAEEYLTKGDLDQAFEFAQKAIELKSVEAHYVTGLIYFKGKKWSEAVTEFEKLLRIKVNHLSALLHLGKSFDALGRLEKATETFHKALKLDNDNPQVQEAWIEFCVKSKDKETAIPNLTTILDKAVTGNNAEQMAKYSKMMIRLEPNFVFAHIKLIEALQTLGDLYGAADAFCALASIYEKQNQFNDATQCLEKALVLTPSNAEVLEKALAWMREKELRVKSFPALKTNIEKSITPESSDSDAIFQSIKTKPVEPLIESPVHPPLQPISSNTLETQMAMATRCVQQGFLKAAIEIYQQILETNPGQIEVRKKLIEINAIYMKKFTESK